MLYAREKQIFIGYFRVTTNHFIIYIKIKVKHCASYHTKYVSTCYDKIDQWNSYEKFSDISTSYI